MSGDRLRQEGAHMACFGTCGKYPDDTWGGHETGRSAELAGWLDSQCGEAEGLESRQKFMEETLS